MAENSKIEWTDHTVNLWWGCTKVHAGCDHCYAEHLAVTRFKNDVWGNNKPRRRIKSAFGDLDRFQREAQAEGVTKRVFVGSMMDIFEKSKGLANPDQDAKYTDDLRQRFFKNITDGKYPNLEFLLLTKRPSNISKIAPLNWYVKTPSNVIFGTSVSDQETADNLVPQIIVHVPHGARIFLSIEPQLAEVSLSGWIVPKQDAQPSGNLRNPISWVIVGGESGDQKRPYDANWARLLRDECEGADVPFFMKQIDKVQPVPEDLLIRQFPNR